MAFLYHDLTLAAQTAFAGLNQAAQQADLRRSVADVPGGFAKKEVAGRTYWYYQLRNADGTLVQTYVGPDDEITRQLIERHNDGSAKAAHKHLVAMTRAAIELGVVPIPPKHSRVIERLAERGLFSAGAILVGTHAFLAYQNHFGVQWGVGDTALDLDFEHAGKNVSLALPGNLKVDGADAIESLQMGFVPNNSHTSFVKKDEPDFDLDFLTSRGRHGDKPVKLEQFNLTMQPLRFMELSIEDPMRATLACRNGPIVVNIPKPVRYAIHKLIVSCERSREQRAKAVKDRAQAAALLDYLLDHDADEIAAMWQDVGDRGPTWLKRRDQGFKAMVHDFPRGEFPVRLEQASASLEADQKATRNRSERG